MVSPVIPFVTDINSGRKPERSWETDFVFCADMVLMGASRSSKPVVRVQVSLSAPLVEVAQLEDAANSKFVYLRVRVPSSAPIWNLSSVGQSSGLINRWAMVRIHEVPPYKPD